MTRMIRFRHLSFAGPETRTVSLAFECGPNVVYGASNTGKSFTLAALKYMLGSSTPLPAIEQLEGYKAALLGIDVPGVGEVTLYRSLSGGGLELFDGLHLERPQGFASRVLAAEHDATSVDNVSRFILDAIGLDGRKIVRNENGEKNSFTLRSLDPFMFVDEGAIIESRSPILSGQHTSATAEKNAFKLLLTGRDDSAVVAVVPPKIRKARQEGQRELLEEWISSLNAQIAKSNASRTDLEDQLKRLDEAMASMQADLARSQTQLDFATRERRSAVDEQDRLMAESREIELTLARFARLLEVYDSDLARLEALEQGGHLLLARLDRPCPLCGATAEHQHSDTKGDLSRAKSAARAEIARIEREQRDLTATMGLLEGDSRRHVTRLHKLSRRLAAADRMLASLRPSEAGLRDRYQSQTQARVELRETLKLFDDRDRLLSQLSAITSAKSTPKMKLSVGIDGPTGHQFANTVRDVLREWDFPGDPSVTFDEQAQDIALNGKERRANGKGVRAVLHSAFKVAVLLYCQERRLPHPGVLVLDTPLLTYREPKKVPKHGALSEDEKALAATSLHENFYRHLVSLKDRAQFIILENSDPPAHLIPALKAHFFTGDEGTGRLGLFPGS